MKNDSLGDRMKRYEDSYRFYLTPRTPVIMRLDGRAFHTLTKRCVRPFDSNIELAMQQSMWWVCKNISGAKIGYTQSDEISVLITDFDSHTTEAWFDNNIQKMCSIAASMTSVTFSRIFGRDGYFDCRVFNIPKEEVSNYFIWRQKDWMRNSLSMFARAYFTQKELHKKSQSDMHEMLHTKNQNWANLPSYRKNGMFYDIKEDKFISDLILTYKNETIDKYLYLTGEESKS